jgi:exodeoxyribonuclease VII small subunit
MPPKPPPDHALTFDQAMTQAEDLLARMESGDMELEDALKAYERGMALLARCKVVLATAQQRVEEISAAADLAAAKPEPDDTDGPGTTESTSDH